MIAELRRPARDPRGEFVTATLKEGVETIKDVMPGMIMEGTVSNVAAFGAFVDLGVHQDGLIHVSAMSNKFISDPREMVSSGQIVKVKVLEVDTVRKRISLTLRLDDELPAAGEAAQNNGPRERRGAAAGRSARPGQNRNGQNRKNEPAKNMPAAPRNTAMAEALRRAGLGK